MAPATAEAACPGIFNGEACQDICVESGLDINCVMDYLGTATQGADAHFVTYAIDEGEYTAQFQGYGFDALGNEFCCEIEYSCGFITTEIFNIDGASGADRLDLNDSVAGKNLECGRAYVTGYGDDDELIASDVCSIESHLYGSDGADTLRGRTCDDELKGEDGADVLYGNDGADTVFGGAGADRVKGGTGVDTVYGGADDDLICGEGDADVLWGETGDDSLFGGGSTDFIDGGTGSADTCENDDEYNCESNSLTACGW